MELSLGATGACRHQPMANQRQRRRRKTPSYRERTGYGQAIVTLRDSETGYRRDFWLGEYDSPESRER